MRPKYSATDIRIQNPDASIIEHEPGVSYGTCVQFSEADRRLLLLALEDFSPDAVERFIRSLEEESFVFNPWSEPAPLPTPKARVGALRNVAVRAKDLASLIDEINGEVGADWHHLNQHLGLKLGSLAIATLQEHLDLLALSANRMENALIASPRMGMSRAGHKSTTHELAFQVALLMKGILAHEPSCSWSLDEPGKISPYMNVLAICHRAWKPPTGGGKSLNGTRTKLMRPAQDAIKRAAQAGATR